MRLLLAILLIASSALAADLPPWAAPLQSVPELPPAPAVMQPTWVVSSPLLQQALTHITWIAQPGSAATIRWIALPGSSTLVAWTQTPGGAQIVGWSVVPRGWSAHVDWQELLEEAGVTMLPHGFHAMSPLGIRWARLYRGDSSWLFDEEYRGELVDLMTEIREAQERRAAIRAMRGR